KQHAKPRGHPSRQEAVVLPSFRPAPALCQTQHNLVSRLPMKRFGPFRRCVERQNCSRKATCITRLSVRVLPAYPNEPSLSMLTLTECGSKRTLLVTLKASQRNWSFARSVSAKDLSSPLSQL